MKKNKLKRVTSALLIMIGAIALIIEMGGENKNFYLQSLGVCCLMVGLFLVNSTLTSRRTKKENPKVEEEL